MRVVHNAQLEFEQVLIEDISIDPKSRDDIPAILKALQLIYTDELKRQ